MAVMFQDLPSIHFRIFTHMDEGIFDLRSYESWMGLDGILRFTVFCLKCSMRFDDHLFFLHVQSQQVSTSPGFGSLPLNHPLQDFSSHARWLKPGTPSSQSGTPLADPWIRYWSLFNGRHDFDERLLSQPFRKIFSLAEKGQRWLGRLW